jgi:hypothetical protein
VIAFSDYDLNTMKVAKCNDAACAGANETITDLATPGRAKAIRIGLDGNPVIAYELIGNFALAVTKCNDPACAGNNETTTVVDDTANVLAGNLAMVVRFSGRPLIVHSDQTTATLRVVDCNDVACAGQNETISVLIRQRQVDRRVRYGRARRGRRRPARDRVPQQHRQLGALRALRRRPLLPRHRQLHDAGRSGHRAARHPDRDRGRRYAGGRVPRLQQRPRQGDQVRHADVHETSANETSANETSAGEARAARADRVPAARRGRRAGVRRREARAGRRVHGRLATVDGGGARSTGGSYVLTGTIGQADADPLQPSEGGVYQLDGGWWGGAGPIDGLFRDSFE